MEVCVRELDVLCRQGLTIGLAFAISLGFSIVIIIGLVRLRVAQSFSYSRLGIFINSPAKRLLYSLICAL